MITMPTASTTKNRAATGVLLGFWYVLFVEIFFLVQTPSTCDAYQFKPTTKATTATARSVGYEIQPKFWEYQSKHEIGYEVAATTQKQDTKTNGSSKNNPILLLNGFGVGSFHQHRLIHELLTNGNFDDGIVGDGRTAASNSNTAAASFNNSVERTVYCMDYLGQGRSWPKNCNDGLGETEQNLQYSADTWCQQIIDFLEAVVLADDNSNNENDRDASNHQKKVHLVGNSVGGHLAAHVALRRPDLVSSLALLNPTPVWGSRLPGWDGHLPAPAIPKLVGRYLFDKIRDPQTIEQFLTATYYQRDAFSETLMNQIRGCTLGDGGHAAFASIMWSPPLVSPTSPGGDTTTTDYYDCLRHVSCDVLLVFGTDDPWCKPAFAKSMIEALEDREKRATTTGRYHRPPIHRYFEISRAGHCPNHESPRAVSHLLEEWIHRRDDDERREDSERAAFPRPERFRPPISFAEEWGSPVTVRERRKEDIKVGWVDRIVTKVM